MLSQVFQQLGHGQDGYKLLMVSWGRSRARPRDRGIRGPQLHLFQPDHARCVALPLQGDREMWGQISHGTQEHYNSLLATHQLLVAVSDLCQQAAATLASASQHLQPLLVSFAYSKVKAPHMNLTQGSRPRE